MDGNGMSIAGSSLDHCEHGKVILRKRSQQLNASTLGTQWQRSDIVLQASPSCRFAASWRFRRSSAKASILADPFMKTNANAGQASDNTCATPRARLRAIVSVDMADKVRCQQPECGHSVYAAIHVVEEDGHLLVLGSTCFEKRYGGAHMLGRPQYGAGSGRKLTEAERLLLINNTQALLARFEAYDRALAEEAALAAERARASYRFRKSLIVEQWPAPTATMSKPQSRPEPDARTHGPTQALRSPWPWQMNGTSVALFTASDGTHWVRVQHRDGSQKLVPWPPFDGWQDALPAGVGTPNVALGAIAIDNIVEAIKVLQQNGFAGPQVGRWTDLPRRFATKRD